MGQSIYGVPVDAREHLERIQEALELAGVPTERDDRAATLSFSLNNTDVVEFQVDPRVLKDEIDYERWSKDMEAVADFYWRQ